ncbi:erythromycin esterase family protein, partial [Bacillus subtilis]|uniref:erythromycin esterase family protein n=1 Tax=Bacillus subtilis TaxID=1423 RepID=UPI00227F5051
MSRNKKNIKIEIDWLIKRVQRINESDTNNYSELDFLYPLLSDKRIILLGENGHGVAEHAKIKKKLIKYLYEKLGFRVLAFESSLGDCSLSYIHDFNLSPKKLVKQSLFKVWHTEEMIELFKWLKDN